MRPQKKISQLGGTALDWYLAKFCAVGCPGRKTANKRIDRGPIFNNTAKPRYNEVAFDTKLLLLNPIFLISLYSLHVDICKKGFRFTSLNMIIHYIKV